MIDLAMSEPARGRRAARRGGAGAKLCALLFGTALAAPAAAEMSAEELAKLAQNPVGNLISVPFQNNTNLNFGPDKGTQNILNIQPVIPISVNNDWNIITRTILPVLWQPSLGRAIRHQAASATLSSLRSCRRPTPANGSGARARSCRMPTNSNAELGNKNWGLGPSFVVLHLDKGSPWVYGVLVNNMWSLGEQQMGGSYNNGLIQPFLNYNLPDGAVSHARADPHRQLERGEQPAVDRSDRRRRRQDLPLRQAAGEHAGVGVLQRRATG